MKKILVILALIILSVSFAYAVCYGDANKDWKIDTKDLVIARNNFGLINDSLFDKRTWIQQIDMNLDSRINILDLILIRSLIINNETNCDEENLSCSSFGYEYGNTSVSYCSNGEYDLSRCYNINNTCNDIDSGNDEEYNTSYVSFSVFYSYGRGCNGSSSGGGGGGVIWDKCDLTNNNLIEGICYANGNAGTKIVECENGCSNGACIIDW